MGFLPNGDLILISLDDCKIYLYSFKNKSESTPWKYSQTYDIEIPKSLRMHRIECFICQTKLFLININEGCIMQWNLLRTFPKSSMSFLYINFLAFDMQYNLFELNISKNGPFLEFNMVTNQNQTLLALNNGLNIDIFSMETGIWISRYGWLLLQYFYIIVFF
jgi:hypothetical protein